MAFAAGVDRAWDDEAQAIFLAGRYQRFLSEIENTSSPQLLLLAAKALARIGDLEESLKCLAALAAPGASEPQVAVHALFQEAAVRVATGDAEGAAGSLESGETAGGGEP